MLYSDKNNLIIGAGPAGLAVAARLRKAGEDFIILEKSSEIAHSWQNHYHRLCLHTVKKYSHLPFLPFPADYPKYVPRQKLVEYYEAYAQQFDIKPLFAQEIKKLKRDNALWHAETTQGKVFSAKNVFVCTGFNRVPVRPCFKKEEVYSKKIIHSRDYRNAKKFTGQKVLVIGMGNTGAEIALDLYEQGAFPYISVRSKINIVPRDFNGRSIQETAALLKPIPNCISDSLGKLVQKIKIGNLSKYGVEKPAIAPAAQLRKYGKTPVIDLGTVAQIKKGTIKIVPDVKQFTPTGLLFVDDTQQDFDAVILATGYRAGIEDFLENAKQYFNSFNVPKQVVFAKDNIYFVGFDAYANGLLNSIFNDSAVAIQHLISAQK